MDSRLLLLTGSSKLFKSIHELYISTISSPFAQEDAAIESLLFRTRIDGIVQAYQLKPS
jgi:hypothetical protein